ncbi:hypothetical protein D915_007281 [Fasciola hepatica]|uniref:Apple domain-containing protein n=1 Tax=Fasciola hepatica TaxID=6192 RepID=A0A4E0RWB1_FASHE|nr:hypothetical protein D915_007281 [Fasciola hepatica]
MHIMNKLLWICLAQIFIIYCHDLVCIPRGLYDVRLMATEKSYCEAHLTCLTEGKSKSMIGYMTGRELPKRVANMKLSRNMWINVHSRFQNTGSSATCKWVFGEEANHLTGAGLNISQFNITDSKDLVVIYTVDREIRAISDDDNLLKSFACRFLSDNKIGQIIQQEMFRREGKSGTYSKQYNCRSQGCSTTAFNLTRIQCAVKCQMDSVCRSFYYKSQEQECIHAKYVDLLLRNQSRAYYSPDWERFSRPKWNLSEESRN